MAMCVGTVILYKNGPRLFEAGAESLLSDFVELSLFFGGKLVEVGNELIRVFLDLVLLPKYQHKVSQQHV